MPTYEYVCTECATPLEAVASFTDPPLTQCPACGGRLRKVFGNVGVVFKGSGFYRTDSRSKSSSTAPATVSKSSSESTSASTSSDSSSNGGSGSSKSGSAKPVAAAKSATG